MNDEVRLQSDYWNQEAHAFQQIYSHEKSSVSNFLDRLLRRDMYDRFVFTILHSEPITSRSFLDVGCGSGHYCAEFARRGAASVVGLDIADNMLELARRTAIVEDFQDRCVFLHTDLLEYRANKSFDVSIGIGLFDYIRDPLPVLKKMREVTVRRSIVSFPRLWTWRAPVRKLRLSARGCPVYFYSKREVVDLLGRAGFRHVDVHRVGKLFCAIADA